MKIADYSFRILVATFGLLAIVTDVKSAATLFVITLTSYFLFLFFKDAESKLKYLSLILAVLFPMTWMFLS
ncbi:hypothetical protein [Aureibacillus halotolerans]|uniref:hypothetical protein n=1 Tax=Aureibacillus halotolerans TaxID=1508390 RepID=UPI00105C5436|nr:hypothetical protein [Aureibacillus halotolerans]